ncbi:hypothetical protein FO488_10885 [Geobacter sp. FeAm09]|uniref:hypothetical protein n=1 Tax=Geobacter sp. FeAm09 TaxID=2597769 RepID=UPI0011EE8CF2|nr:hypothetical protein [Geobacter sp. FeAm09]QEM68621.1 hypothetical protein FO488_10885 [Geobacter sp. FeAm09]
MARAAKQVVGKKSTVAVTPKKKAAPKGGSAKSKALVEKSINDMSGEELVIANFATLSKLVEALGETLEMLVQKAESMAYHIIATEEILAELVAANGLNLAQVNARIRTKIAAGTANLVDPARAIDVAATIASPQPRR